MSLHFTSVADEPEQRGLIERVKEGDVAAFERLVEPHLPRVRRFARSMVSDPADADDIAQDALLKAYLGIRNYRHRSSFSTWLYRIVRNTCIDAARSAYRKRRDRSEPLGDDNEPEAGAEGRPEHALQLARQRERLWAALRRLPPEYRTAVLLFDLEGFAQDEVAAIEAVSVGTVKSRISRGRKQLRTLLESDRAFEYGNASPVPFVKPERSH